jgi:hypothetical protein
MSMAVKTPDNAGKTAQSAMMVILKIVDLFTKISDQRERAFYSERQLEMVGGPAASSNWLPALPPYSPFFTR